MDETEFNLQFKFLNLPLGSIRSKWRFLEHRITLRVEMWLFCSTRYYSSSWDMAILLYESLLFELRYGYPALRITENIKITKKQFGKALSRLPKLQKRLPPKFHRLSIFSPAHANLIPNFSPDKTYKPKNPSGWHYLLEKPSPKMDSKPNSNGWNRIWSALQILKVIAGKHTFKMKISRTSYNSSYWDMAILLYE